MRVHPRFDFGALLFCALLASSVAQADDLNPPPFRLTHPSSTVQEWDYNSPAVPLPPDGSVWGIGGGGHVNPFGLPALTAVGAATWLPSHGGAGVGVRPGVYALAGLASVLVHEIPNVGDPFGRKGLWIQVSWARGAGGLRPEVVVEYPGGAVTAAPGLEFLMPDNWVHTTYVAAIDPCPPVERVRIAVPTAASGFFVDQVVVDTICEDDFRVVRPTNLTVRFGRVDAGGVSSLALLDGDVLRVCRFLVPNLIVPPVQFEVEALGTGITNLDALRLEVVARMATGGLFSLELELFDYVLAAYRDSVVVNPFGTTFTTQSVLAASPVAAYSNAAGDLKARAGVRRVGPAAAFAWCAEFDLWNWFASN